MEISGTKRYIPKGFELGATFGLLLVLTHVINSHVFQRKQREAFSQ